MKRLLTIALALLLALSIAACGAADENTADNTPKLDVNALGEEMAAASELPEMLTITTGDSRAERGFSAISDLSYDKVDAFYLTYASDGTAYEIAVIRLKNSADMTDLKKSLESHLSSRVEQFRYYKPEQVENAEKAVVAVRGSYAALIMCDDPAAVRSVFDKAFN